MSYEREREREKERERERERERRREREKEREREREGERLRFEWLISLVMLDLWTALRVEVDAKRCPKVFPDVSQIRK